MSRTEGWVGAVALVTLLLFAGLWVVFLQTQPALRVDIRAVYSPPPSLAVAYTLATDHGWLPVHLGLVPGHTDLHRTRDVYIVYDPSFRLRYATPGDLQGLVSRVGAETAGMGSGVHVGIVSADRLSNVLATEPDASLAFLGGANVMDPLLSVEPSPLRAWVAGGGTVFWAGGPAGFYDGRSEPDGTFLADDAGWPGQERLFGFPLEDVSGDPSYGSRGWLYANESTPLALVLGLSYRGTGDGANISQVAAHGGTDLGYDTLPSPGSGAAPRTSLAYIPIGLGGVYYFGGAVWASGLGAVPSGDVSLSEDIALLAGLAYVPGGGPGVTRDLVVGSGPSISVTLSLDAYPYGAVAFAMVSVNGDLLLFQAIEIVPGRT